VDKGRFAIEVHLRTGRSIGELARVYDLDRSWLYRRLARDRREGEAGLELRSRRPKWSPSRVGHLFENEIVAVRKELSDASYDAGDETIRVHLARRHANVPSTSTMWRVLKARGFVTPQPHKRPQSSLRRFAADVPNECWQADVTHVEGADGVVFEVLRSEVPPARRRYGLLSGRASPATRRVLWRLPTSSRVHHKSPSLRTSATRVAAVVASHPEQCDSG
jgi:hypothetical protein